MPLQTHFDINYNIRTLRSARLNQGSTIFDNLSPEVGKETWGVCDDCGLQVCFNEKFKTCYRANDYTGYPKLGVTQAARSAPDVNKARARALARAEMRHTQRLVPQGLAAVARTRRERSTLNYEAINANPLVTPVHGSSNSTPSSSRPAALRRSGIRSFTRSAVFASHYGSPSTSANGGGSSSTKLSYELCDRCGECFLEEEFPAHGCFSSD
ncbi:hypothetical protein M422DRAFT_259372 [Sphaerobolus stellatus SS14]|uniref:Unplaced genomic scaffold SPHSTscaffold_89, whole genome shotgun sequence n=1 Tax=Sphaerobolus stellatus (strain SS14) TaxID=990650 RepID=A0A0C9VKK0_SPHS4|nr:hypothetical protein M422DRAFT_259372 [Sphaerobolus stellatus SS14]